MQELARMNFLERTGHITGHILGLTTGTISFLRAARMFHPRGTLVAGSVENLAPHFITFPPNVMVRFSSALWKNKIWPDVLGLTCRFSKEKNFSYSPANDDQDLLFASFKHPWQTPVGPFLTSHRDFFANSFFAVSPFNYQDGIYIFKITPHRYKVIDKRRPQKLHENIKSHAVWRLWMKKGKECWKEVADITLEEELLLDQEKLKFNPFLNGLQIYPRGFIHYLRIGAYRMSQSGRSLRYRLRQSI